MCGCKKDCCKTFLKRPFYKIPVQKSKLLMLLSFLPLIMIKRIEP